jgi:hypothetical protein
LRGSQNPSSRSANFLVARFPDEEDDGQGGRKFFFGQTFSVKSLNVFGVAQVTIIHNADLTKFGY